MMGTGMIDGPRSRSSVHLRAAAPATISVPPTIWTAPAV
jgi:hypothetical protein